MSSNRGHIVLVDDDERLCAALADGLSRRGFVVRWHTSGRRALEAFGGEDVDAVVADLNMPGIDGLALCREILEARPHVPVLLITAFGSLDTAVEAIRAGAYDFITKPVELDALELAVERAVSHRRLHEEVRRLREAVAQRDRSAILGDSAAIRRVHDLVTRVAPTQATVLITGESGTGKELVARSIHHLSGRSGPFVAINCAAMPEQLLDSELFGHTKGAFTDARADRVGLFVEADGGTLFLDEIGDLPLLVQAKLLRALQERCVRPVGSNTEVKFDARVVAATNRDLEVAISTGEFREDLYFRLGVVTLDMPPLRVRGDDILVLAQHFLDDAATRHQKSIRGLTGSVARTLLSYPWPGNVRELQHAIERAVIMAQHDHLMIEDLPDRVAARAAAAPVSSPGRASDFAPMAEVERSYVLEVLEAVGGNRTLAAQILGFDRRTISRKLKAYGLADAD